MIDTIFFLLIYFVMAGLADTQAIPRTALATVGPVAPDRSSAPVVVTVARDGRCYVDEMAVDEKSIPRILQARLKADPRLTVMIDCDADQSVANFTRVYDLAKQANPSAVMIATAPSTAGERAQ